MYWLYQFLLWLAFPLLWIKLWISHRDDVPNRERLCERFGQVFYPTLSQCLWVHTVSVGEAIAATPLIKQLQKRYPNSSLLITTTTRTGSDYIQKTFGASLHHYYLPYDYRGAVRRFLKANQPIIAIIFETELWPNLLIECQRRRIPIFLANARLSEKSCRGYQKLGKFIKRLLNCISMIGAQDPLIAERFKRLGASQSHLHIVGNLKFALEFPQNQSEKVQQLKRQLPPTQLWIAASTHPGEEEIIVEAHQQLLKQHPQLLLILVPRHPDRLPALLPFLKKNQFQTVLVSELLLDKPFPNNTNPVILGDTIGDLMTLYALADAAFVGGSLVPVGGHNIIEPVMLGLPVVTGPHMFNFEYVHQLFTEEQLAQVVIDAPTLAEAIHVKLLHPEQKQVILQKSQALHKELQESLFQHLRIIASLLPDN